MKNTKQPIYDKSNLIDFKRKNLWMNRIEKTKNPGDSSLKLFIIGLVIVWLMAVINIWA